MAPISLVTHQNCVILGATWAGEHDANARENGGLNADEVDSGYFERLGARTEIFFEKCFTAWGTWCANNPWLVLFFGENSFNNNQIPVISDS